MLGELLSSLVTFDDLKLIAGALLLSPFVPLLFMGEEQGETSPFLYFVDHSDPSLIEAVRKGRTEEFAAFAWRGEPPDPQSEETFLRSKLPPDFAAPARHNALFRFYQQLLRLRRDVPALRQLSKDHLEIWSFARENTLILRRWCNTDEVLTILCFRCEPATVSLHALGGRWNKLVDSMDETWDGPGSISPATIDSDGKMSLRVGPRALLVYQRIG